MTLVRKPRILLLTDDARNAFDWSLAIAGAAAVLWRSCSEVPDGEQVDVIVRQGGIAQEAKIESADNAPGLRPKVIWIGETAGSGADLVLPIDVTPRELRLACELLAEIRQVEREREQLAESHRATRQMAETDPLTGLANRRLWDQEVQAHSELANTGKPTHWLGIADLDHFKQVNEAAGYAAGDRTLVSVGRRLASQLRRGDLLARLGGDEFGILLSGLDQAQARLVFERLASALLAPVDSEVVEEMPLSISIGYGPLGPAGGNAAFAMAERGLRQAKLAGGNRVVAGDNS